MTDKDLVLLNEADKALALATSVPELKDLRGAFTAAKAYAKGRGLGVEAENKASEYILRTERKIGAELERTLPERRAARSVKGAIASGWKPTGDSSISVEFLTDLGITSHQATDWKRAARLSDDEFERLIEAARKSRERIATIKFYRVPKDPAAPDPETPGNKSFAAFQRGAQGLLGWKDGAPTRNELMFLPDDQLATLRALVQSLVDSYGEAVKARRG